MIKGSLGLYVWLQTLDDEFCVSALDLLEVSQEKEITEEQEVEEQQAA